MLVINVQCRLVHVCIIVQSDMAGSWLYLSSVCLLAPEVYHFRLDFSTQYLQSLRNLWDLIL